MADVVDLSLHALSSAYHQGANAHDVIAAAVKRIDTDAQRNAWIHVQPRDELAAAVLALEQRREAGDKLPLFGVPFGVKDNINVAGMPTTAACPDFAYWPERSAHVVELLLAAGAICIGKTNLDQFATGLSGTRSPYGACSSVGNAAYLSGGSSSGSAVAVAAGHVSFALGTDTGGSGRIPAGFNGIVGIKPTVGRLSSRGLVPNCPSIDCPSIFAKTVSDGTAIMKTIDGFDPEDAFSLRPPLASGRLPRLDGPEFNFGRLRPEQIETFGMPECIALYEQACARLVRIGGNPQHIDFTPFIEAGRLLFDGPWIAERRASLRPFVDTSAGSLLEITRRVLKSADKYSATDTFSAMHRLARLRREAGTLFHQLPVLVVPSAPRPFTLAEMAENPVELNSRLGHYSYHANLLHLCGVAVPNGVMSCGVPMGVTFLASAWHDNSLADLAARFESETLGDAMPVAISA